jgi:hypothetical protein
MRCSPGAGLGERDRMPATASSWSPVADCEHLDRGGQPAPRARQAMRWSRPALNSGLLSLRVARLPVQARDGVLNDHFQELGVDLFP